MRERRSSMQRWGEGSGGGSAGRMRRGAAGLALALLAITVACASTDRFIGMDGDELWTEAERAYESENWSEAIEIFDLHLSVFPGHLRNPDVRILRARAHMERGEYLSAAADFERFIQLYPGHGMVPDAAIGICRAYYRASLHPQRDQTNTRRARDACAETALDFQGLSIAEEADSLRREMHDRLAQRRYEEGRFYQRRSLYNSAILIFESVVSEFDDTDWGPRALVGLYRSYRSLGWDDEAEEALEQLMDDHPDSEVTRRLLDELGRPAPGTDAAAEERSSGDDGGTGMRAMLEGAGP